MKTFSYSELSTMETILLEQLIDYQNVLESYKGKPESGMFRVASHKMEEAQRLLNRVKEVLNTYFS